MTFVYIFTLVSFFYFLGIAEKTLILFQSLSIFNLLLGVGLYSMAILRSFLN